MAILRSLRLKRLRLLTNNPAKLAALTPADLQVDQQPFLVSVRSPEAHRYLAAKARNGYTTPRTSPSVECVSASVS